MRFRFCGDLDAPDWLLAEIVTLSRISSVRMRVVVKQVLRFVATGELDSEKVLKLTKDSFPSAKGPSDLKGALAALDFIVTSAAKYDVEDYDLQEELQQLGLPKENSEAITKQYRTAKDQLRRRLEQKSYRVNRMLDTAWGVKSARASTQEASPTTAADRVVQLKFSVDERPAESTAQKQEAEGEQRGEAPTAVAPGRVRKIAVEMSSERLNVLYRYAEASVCPSETRRDTSRSKSVAGN